MTVVSLLFPAIVSIFGSNPRASAASSLEGALERDHFVRQVYNPLGTKVARLKCAVSCPPD